MPRPNGRGIIGRVDQAYYLDYGEVTRATPIAGSRPGAPFGRNGVTNREAAQLQLSAGGRRIKWEDNNYRFSLGSSSRVDSGKPNSVTDGGATDLDGYARVLCGLVDMVATRRKSMTA